LAVEAYCLACSDVEPFGTAKPADVDFRQRLCSAGDVLERVADYRPVTDWAALLQLLKHPMRRAEPLLHDGRQQPGAATDIVRPAGGVQR